MKKYLVLIVNYKKKLMECDSIKSLIYLDKEIINNLQIFIWDNLPIDGNDLEFQALKTKGLKIEYYPSKTNQTLSKIYNIIIKTKLSKNDFLILLDNDSKFNSEYIFQVEKSINSIKSNLYLPLIKCNEKIVSPEFIKSYEKLKFGKNSTTKLSAINSGMIISTKYLYYQFEGYDERINFYGTDDDFIKKYKKKNSSFCLINYSINHNLSNMQEEAIEKKIWRYKDSKNAIKILNSETLFIKILIFLKLKKSDLKMAFKYKNLEFLKD